MGISSSKDFQVIVKTGDVKGAGTDSNIYCALIDSDGNRTSDVKLDCFWKDDFEKGNVDTFTVRSEQKIGSLARIELWRDKSGLKDDWFLEYIKVIQYTKSNSSLKDLFSTKEEIPFPINRWIKADQKYTFEIYDCSLPQDDENTEQRKREIEDIKSRYLWEEKDTGLPRRIKELPVEELFSNDYKWDIVKRKAELILQQKWNSLITTNNFDSFDDYESLFKGTFGVPYGFSDWKSDKRFGQQRLRGCNPTLIRLCTELPDNFPVTNEMVESFLDGKKLDEAIKAKEVFIVNLKELEGISVPEGRTLTKPMALFHAKKNGDILPIAIQLFQTPSEDNPIFLPSDPLHKWMLAKMYYNNSDVVIHQACTHLGFTHLVCESMCICMHRTLSPSHPVYRLLAPHFLFLLAINMRGVTKLMAKGAWIDVTMTPGIDGTFEIMSQRWHKWRLDINGWLPGDLAERGVDDTTNLPKYFYRDDALPIHHAIVDYVTEIIDIVYENNETLAGDNEIQDFAKMLVDKKDGAGMEGVFGNGEFKEKSDLIKVVSAVIFMSSVQHAAANFCQYDEYAFSPFYPAFMRGEVPNNKDEITEEDIVKHLPEKSMALDIMVVTNLLSERGTNNLGEFEIQYQYEPKKLQAVKRFQTALKEISTTIKARNKEREHPYPYLDPEVIPNAISI